MQTVTVGDALRKRLQLRLGPAIALGDEVPPAVRGRAFVATASDGTPVRVTVLPAPPEGLSPGEVKLQIAKLRQLNHPGLALPTGEGDVEGHVWIVEPLSQLGAVPEPSRARPAPIPQAVSAIRDLARALAAMHRRGLTHGAVRLEHVHLDPQGARLSGCATERGGSVRGDLDGLGVIAWRLLSGDADMATRPLSRIRRGVSPALDALCESFCARNPADRPQRAEVVLAVLDAMPTRRNGPIASMIDAGGYDARSRRTLGWLAAALVVAGAIFMALHG